MKDQTFTADDVIRIYCRNLDPEERRVVMSFVRRYKSDCSTKSKKQSAIKRAMQEQVQKLDDDNDADKGDSAEIIVLKPKEATKEYEPLKEVARVLQKEVVDSNVAILQNVYEISPEELKAKVERQIQLQNEIATNQVNLANGLMMVDEHNQLVASKQLKLGTAINKRAVKGKFVILTLLELIAEIILIENEI